MQLNVEETGKESSITQCHTTYEHEIIFWGRKSGKERNGKEIKTFQSQFCQPFRDWKKLTIKKQFSCNNFLSICVCMSGVTPQWERGNFPQRNCQQKICQKLSISFQLFFKATQSKSQQKKEEEERQMGKKQEFWLKSRVISWELRIKSEIKSASLHINEIIQNARLRIAKITKNVSHSSFLQHTFSYVSEEPRSKAISNRIIFYELIPFLWVDTELLWCDITSIHSMRSLSSIIQSFTRRMEWRKKTESS